MNIERLFGSVLPVLAVIGCQAADEHDLGEGRAYIGTTGTIPTDATCTHIVATRLADFVVSEYKGALSGGVFSVQAGESRVTATAYPPPCSAEPAQPPWIADEQITTFTDGANTLMLRFHANTQVAIDPTFDDINPLHVTVRPGSPIRTGRNGEDAAGPNYSLDGWEIKRIALPPEVPSETVLFSTEGKGALAFSPRGLAAMPDGTFAVQLSAPAELLRQFSATGDFLEFWSVIYPAGATRFDNTDGLEAIDATHLVRTGFLNAPIDCDASGAGCHQAGLEILELVTAAGGGHELHVVHQLFLPDLPGRQLNLAFPVGVAPVGTGFAVTTLPNDGSATRLALVDASGALIAGPVPVTGDVEGLFVASDGRLGVLDYHGHLTMRDAATLGEHPGETAFYGTGADLPLPTSLAWDSANNQFLVLTSENRLAFASTSLSSPSDVGIDLSGYVLPSGLDYRPDTDQVAIADRFPRFDPVTGTQLPTVDFYDLSTRTLASTVTLRGTSLPVRTISIAYVPSRQQIISHYHRPGGTADPAVDGVVYTHNLDGTLAGSFDLAPFGFPRIQSLSYLPRSDELVITATDRSGGIERLIVTSPTGKPRRSYRLDSIGNQIIDVAQMTSGPASGDLGAVQNQPSNFFELSLP